MDPREKRAAVDNSPWDAAKAWANGAASDNPAAFYNGICAGKKKGDPATQAAHALPHHYHPSDAPNKAGVSAGLGRINQTDGLTNKAAAQAHLDNHAKLWAKKDAQPLSRREAGVPCGMARMQAFPSELRAKLVTRDGKKFYELDGYATTFNQLYTMWDMFGEYKEGVKGWALDKSLDASPDVAFLVNHRGVTMARTTNDTLDLNKDTGGLGIHALLNAERQDVRDFVSAVDDKLVTEMSFAFMLNAGEWRWADETGNQFDEFWITEADVNRGDVSGVNYGANPFTSIGARGAEWLAMAEYMPKAVIAEQISRTAARSDAKEYMDAAKDVSVKRGREWMGAAADMDARAVARREAAAADDAEPEPAEGKIRNATHSLVSAKARYEENK